MSGTEPWIPPGQGSLVGKKFGLISFAFTFLMMGGLTLWEADRSHFSGGVQVGIMLVAFGFTLMLFREAYLARNIPLPVVTGEEIEDTHALIKRYAGHTKSVATRLASVTDDEDVKAKLNAVADIMAEIEA